MKKNFSVLVLISLVLLVLSGCDKNENKQANESTAKQVGQTVKDTPYQIGRKGQMIASVIGFDFKKSYKEADIIAEIRINEWLGENYKDELEKTIFKASLEKIIKNRVDKNLKEIKLLQTGNSNFTIKDFPLFKNNDRLFLYLKKAVGEEYKNSYWILGGHTGVFRIISIDGKAN